jgi:hypothetical protein
MSKLTIDQDYFNEVCGKRYLADDSKINAQEKEFIFARMLRKSDIANEIDAFIDDYIECCIDMGLVDQYRKELAEDKAINDEYERWKQKQIEGEA